MSKEKLELILEPKSEKGHFEAKIKGSQSLWVNSMKVERHEAARSLSGFKLYSPSAITVNLMPDAASPLVLIDGNKQAEIINATIEIKGTLIPKQRIVYVATTASSVDKRGKSCK